MPEFGICSLAMVSRGLPRSPAVASYQAPLGRRPAATGKFRLPAMYRHRTIRYFSKFVSGNASERSGTDSSTPVLHRPVDRVSNCPVSSCEASKRPARNLTWHAQNGPGCGGGTTQPPQITTNSLQFIIGNGPAKPKAEAQEAGHTHLDQQSADGRAGS